MHLVHAILEHDGLLVYPRKAGLQVCNHSCNSRRCFSSFELGKNSCRSLDLTWSDSLGERRNAKTVLSD